MTLSLAMACRSRGAPVKDWSPAPQVEKKEPITMTQGVGQARVPTTRFPLTESPNLQGVKLKVRTTLGTLFDYTSIKYIVKTLTYL